MTWAVGIAFLVALLLAFALPQVERVSEAHAQLVDLGRSFSIRIVWQAALGLALLFGFSSGFFPDSCNAASTPFGELTLALVFGALLRVALLLVLVVLLFHSFGGYESDAHEFRLSIESSGLSPPGYINPVVAWVGALLFVASCAFVFGLAFLYALSNY